MWWVLFVSACLLSAVVVHRVFFTGAKRDTPSISSRLPELDLAFAAAASPTSALAFAAAAEQGGKNALLCSLLDEWLLPELVDVVDGYLRDGASDESLIRCGAFLYLPPAPDPEWIRWACVYGHLDLVKKLLVAFPKHEQWATGAMHWAALKGHLPVVQYLHESKKACTTNAMDWAARNGHLPVVQYLHRIKKECTTQAMEWAARNGHLPVVQYLHEIKKECSSLAMYFAVANGHLPVVQFLHQIGKKCSTIDMDCAVVNGHLPVVQYLHRKGKECTAEAMLQAEVNGHAEVAAFLRQIAVDAGRRPRTDHIPVYGVGDGPKLASEPAPRAKRSRRDD
jgi:hypothetical protein